MNATIAIFLDAYRELNARKLFWITLVLSGLVVIAFGAVGVTDKGVQLAFWELENHVVNAESSPPATFYKWIFTTFGIGFWLTWIATILALVSTAGIFPDMISSGSIELMLSKPISRLRLFLTKALAGLMFVGLQVTVFTLGAFLVIGARGGVWEPGLFIAIPIVLLFFSYLYCVCILLGLLTRSTITAMLLTLLFWAFIAMLHLAETGVLLGRTESDQKVQAYDERIATVDETLARDDGADPDRFQFARDQRVIFVDRLEDALEAQETWHTVHSLLFSAKTVVPKTSETIALLERWLVDLADLNSNEDDLGGSLGNAVNMDGNFVPSQDRIAKAVGEEITGRSVTWVVGTSLAFELVVLVFAGFIFCRRDY